MHSLLCVFTGVFQENIFGEKLLQHWSHLNAFSSVCVFWCLSRKPIWKNFSNFDHIYMALLQCVFSYVFEENLFWKTFTTLIKFIWLFSSVCFLVSFNRTFLGKKTFTILMIFRWLFSSMYFQMYFMRTFFWKKNTTLITRASFKNCPLGGQNASKGPIFNQIA